MKEKILCSAIKMKDWHIILCRRHWDGIRLKRQLYWEVTIPKQQWFWTSKDRFVDRKEAFIIAKNAWQLRTINQIDWEPIDYSNEDTLYSEYVW